MTEESGVGTLGVECRHRVWVRTGDINALWPEVPYGERRTALACVREVITSGITSSEPLTLDPSSECRPRALGLAAFIGGVGPLLGWWVREGRLRASTGTEALLARHLTHAARRIELLRHQVARIARAMRESGSDPILLKGLHTGAEFFPHPSTHPASDIDLLVHPSRRARAETALRLLGFEEVRRTVFAARSEWKLPGSPRVVQSLELDHSENPWTVDLHSALERWYFRGVRGDLGEGAFDTSRRILVDGEPVRVLDQPYLTAFLALHAGYQLGQMQLVRLLDVALSARADASSNRLDWDQFSAVLDRTGTSRFAYPGLALAETLVPDSIPRAVVNQAAREVSPRMLRVLQALRRAELGPLPKRTLAVKLAWAKGGGELLMCLSDLVAPSDDGAGGLLAAYGRRAAAIRRSLSSRRTE